MWQPKRISEFLEVMHGVRITERSIRNHKQRHIPNVELYYLERISQIAAEPMGPDVMLGIGELLVLTIDKTKELLATGGLKPSISNGIEAAKLMLAADLESRRRDTYEEFFQAFEEVLRDRFDDDTRNEIVRSIRRRHKELEAARGQ
jgi:hypothetical protein